MVRAEMRGNPGTIEELGDFLLAELLVVVDEHHRQDISTAKLNLNIHMTTNSRLKI